MGIPTHDQEHPHHISDEFKRALLKKYEPVLRFSAGENFFPMKVDLYAKHASLRRHIPYHRDKTIINAGVEKLDEMCDKGPDHYLQFVPEPPI